MPRHVDTTMRTRHRQRARPHHPRVHHGAPRDGSSAVDDANASDDALRDTMDPATRTTARASSGSLTVPRQRSPLEPRLHSRRPSGLSLGAFGIRCLRTTHGVGRAVASAMLGLTLVVPLTSRQTSSALVQQPMPPPPPSQGMTLEQTTTTTGSTTLTIRIDQLASKKVGAIELVQYGASEAAVKEAEYVVDTLNVEPTYVKGLKKAKLTLVIIPHDAKLTDLPQFAALRGQLTFDGRLWDDVRGVGGHACHGNRVCIGIPEENLARMERDLYGRNSVAVHELAHAIFDYAVKRSVRDDVARIFSERTAQGLPFVSTYAASNHREYWAECTNAFFGRHDEGKDYAWLITHDPQIVLVLTKVYGAP